MLFSLTSFGQCPADAGPDNTVCGRLDTLHAVSSYAGYWEATSFPSTNDCRVSFLDPTTGEGDIYNPNAVVVVTCEGDWTFTWHEINGTCESTDDVVISFSANLQNITTHPIYKTCLDTVRALMDTTGIGDGVFLWSIDVNWPFIDQVSVDFNPISALPLITRNFTDEAFGDSGFVEIPMIVSVFDFCFSTENYTVRFYQTPNNEFLADTIISGNTITLNMTPTSENNYAEWSNADGSYLPYPNDYFYYDFEFMNYGDYGIVFNETNPLGDNHSSCSVSDTVVLHYAESLNPLDFSFLVDTSQLNMPFLLNSLSILNISELSGPYLWKIYQANSVNADSLLYQINAELPDFTFPNAGIYFITLGNVNNKSLNTIVKYAKINVRETGVYINDITSEKQIFPNPTTGQIQMVGEDIEQVEIYNLSGVLIQSTGDITIDLSREAKGIYFVKVTTANAVATQKLILE